MTQFERTFNLMKKPWVIGIYIILVILAYNYLDRPIAIYFHQLDVRNTMPFFKILTVLGAWKVYIVLFLLSGFYFRYMQKNKLFELRIWFLLGCVLIPNILIFILKIGLSRARPDLLFSNNLFGFYWFQIKDIYWSFPSGHAATAFGLACGLGVLFPKYFFIFSSLALLVALSRVFLYNHYLSDIMTGLYLSVLLIGLFTEFLNKMHYLNKIK